MHICLFFLIGTCRLVYGQVVSPYPISDCNNPAGTELQCANQSGCCALAGACCAGGCCPSTAICVNSDTSNEQCCDISDDSRCGAAVTDSAPSCPSAVKIHPSKQCVGVEDDWYCPWDSLCNYASGGCMGGKVRRDNCDVPATATASEPESETDSFIDDTADVTDDSSYPTNLGDTSSSALQTGKFVAVSVKTLLALLLTWASVFIGL
ncbi:hypothetical protein BKA59DRAFT_461523 [Fusarium tricinctum]|uniref:Uncharacterized protein n=1 Tax=Fusarium tricinctum TaxID=61284 RepID=A0A8K0S366_9HYPO|nr:hypothetical protein BKA59DRAFT_461523 [Fusarium tricinctum]